MTEPALLPFSAWESFYVIVGSSAAALTGLMFVVVTLIVDVPRSAAPNAFAAYGTPTVVHFCVALFISAIVSAPWQAVIGPSMAFGAVGIFGLGYVAIVTRRARKQTEYKPVLEDWVWHTLLPFITYVVVIVSAVTLHLHAVGALFAIGACSLLLLFTGIHNSWDTVTFIAIDRRARHGDEVAEPESVPAAAATEPS